MTGTRPALGCGSLSFSVNRHGTVSTSSPLCASAILARQQNGLKRRSASAPQRSYIVIAMALSAKVRSKSSRPRYKAVIADLYSMATALAATAPRMTTSHGGASHRRAAAAPRGDREIGRPEDRAGPDRRVERRQQQADHRGVDARSAPPASPDAGAALPERQRRRQQQERRQEDAGEAKQPADPAVRRRFITVPR